MVFVRPAGLSFVFQGRSSLINANAPSARFSGYFNTDAVHLSRVSNVRFTLFPDTQAISPPKDLNAFQQAILRQNATVISAHPPAEPWVLGSALLLPMACDKQHIAYLCNLSVESKYRHQKIGTQLVEKAIEHATALQYDYLALRCREGLVPFYQRLGFAPVPAADVVQANATPSLRKLIQETPRIQRETGETVLYQALKQKS